MRRALWSFVLLVVATAWVLPSHAAALQVGGKYAFLIGNAKYGKEKPLRNPPNDVEVIGKSMKQLGFNVQQFNDLDRNGMFELVQKVEKASKSGANTIFVYYSGHGMQSAAKENYLLPVDANISAPSHVERDGTSVGKLIEALRAGMPRLAVLVLDACRDNPFSARTRNVSRGLRREVVEGANLFVAYSTQFGDVAQDGDADTSPYAEALVAYLPKTELPLMQVFDDIGRQVMAVTKNAQQPTRTTDIPFNTTLLGNAIGQAAVISAPAVPLPRVQTIEPAETSASATPAAALAAARQDMDEETWKSVRGSWEPKDFQDYIDRNPNGRFVEAAKREIEILRRAEIELARVRGANSTGAATSSAASASAGVVREAPVRERADADTNVQRKREVAVGKRFRDCAVCPEMVWIPAGTYAMGSPLSERGRGADESEPQAVRIDRALAFGVTEVSFREWDACVAAGGCRRHHAEDGGFGRDSQPVINVSWADALAYASWLSSKTGARYRLPHEFEWEYAARGGAATTYAWGNAVGRNNANCTGCGSRWEGRSPAPIDSFNRNSFDLSDMHGNVAEWVQDCWSERAKDRSHSAPNCQRRVVRGGSWKGSPAQIRAAAREGVAPATRRDDVGFRVVLER